MKYMIYSSHCARNPAPVPNIADIVLDPLISELCPQCMLLFFVARKNTNLLVATIKQMQQHRLAKRACSASYQCGSRQRSLLDFASGVIRSMAFVNPINGQAFREPQQG
ncbi:hypothetical protein SAMN04488498_13915 [Mesorhizobium albiziae]|uniref:Uncharacterized protein n=1 Tax=Neomesorhizobium albiziae TaxID=335020 RepID=A0A1I4F8A8_9HYPH|nr:hypothetical protein SAMN04488498_13915 [Mesorhizobium albiziae]